MGWSIPQMVNGFAHVASTGISRTGGSACSARCVRLGDVFAFFFLLAFQRAAGAAGKEVQV